MSKLQIFIVLILAQFFLLNADLSAAANNQENQTSKDTEILAVKKPAKATRTGDKIYTWIDRRGNRIYSDQPREGAEEMQIEKGTDFDGDAITVKKSSQLKVLPSPDKSYKTLAIVSPPNDATIRNNQGSFQVAVSMAPNLFPGHRTLVKIDGQEVGKSGSSIFLVNNIDRGTHTIIASIVTKEGKVVMTSEPVVVHVHRGGR